MFILLAEKLSVCIICVLSISICVLEASPGNSKDNTKIYRATLTTKTKTGTYLNMLKESNTPFQYPVQCKRSASLHVLNKDNFTEMHTNSFEFNLYLDFWKYPKELRSWAAHSLLTLSCPLYNIDKENSFIVMDVFQTLQTGFLKDSRKGNCLLLNSRYKTVKYMLEQP